MKFFMPLAEDSAQAERAYAGVKAFLKQELGARFSDRRVQHLSWWHEGTHHTARVGEETGFNREVVITILYNPERDLYFVCTPNRGVLGDMPIHVGGPSVTSVGDFESAVPPGNR